MLDRVRGAPGHRLGAAAYLDDFWTYFARLGGQTLWKLERAQTFQEPDVSSWVAMREERYLPFGQRRGSDDLPFTGRGFLGKVEDDATGLDYLSARYYDPTIAKFISTDPLLDAISGRTARRMKISRPSRVRPSATTPRRPGWTKGPAPFGPWSG
jgi:RHS repeat-associated protein